MNKRGEVEEGRKSATVKWTSKRRQTHARLGRQDREPGSEKFRDRVKNGKGAFTNIGTIKSRLRWHLKDTQVSRRRDAVVTREESDARERGIKSQTQGRKHDDDDDEGSHPAGRRDEAIWSKIQGEPMGSKIGAEQQGPEGTQERPSQKEGQGRIADEIGEQSDERIPGERWQSRTAKHRALARGTAKRQKRR